jgi:hypothetical protein
VSRTPVRESWAIALHEALAGFPDVLVGQIVPGGEGYELVLTTRHSPPGGELLAALRPALAPLVGREDSPLAEAATGAGGWHFYPAGDERERELFAELDWTRAVVLHEFVEP